MVHRQGQGRGAPPAVPRCRCRHRGVRQRVVAGAAVQPREAARPYRDRPHGGDPRHLRAERPHARGQGAGRAGAAALPPAATPAWRHRQTVAAARRCRCSVRQRRDEARGRSPTHHAPHHQARVRHEGSGGNAIAAAQEPRDERTRGGQHRRLHERRQVHVAQPPDTSGRARRGPAVRHARPDDASPRVARW